MSAKTVTPFDRLPSTVTIQLPVRWMAPCFADWMIQHAEEFADWMLTYGGMYINPAPGYEEVAGILPADGSPFSKIRKVHNPDSSLAIVFDDA